jgi:MFS family permease
MLYGILTNPFAVTGIGMVESSGQALGFVGAATAMAQTVTHRRAGAAQGLARAMGLIGAAIASAFSGWAYSVGGQQLLFFGTAGLVVAISLLAWTLLRGTTGDTPIGDEDVDDADDAVVTGVDGEAVVPRSAAVN